MLKQKGYQVNERISTADQSHSWVDIENSLFEHEYRIVHIAAHGRYSKQNPEESGVLIGKNYYLAAQTVDKLPVVPDFVFLNCCYLGKTDESFKPDAGSTKWNALAASISTELMRIGVKAVVAAGWAVDDDAAKDFALTLYGSLIAGRNFGEAVIEARCTTDSEHSNSWGAYQCYGDPGFRLAKPTTSSEPATSLHGLTERVRNITDTAYDAYRELSPQAWESRRLELLKELTDLVNSPLEWLNGLVKFEFGKAFFELGDLETAHEWFLGSERDWGAEASIKLLQQLSNLEVRLATKKHRDGSSSPALTAKLFKSAEDRLKKLERFHGKASELSNLFGSLHKKRAAVTSNQKNTTDIRAARKRYLEACRLADVEPTADARYPTINAITMGAILNTVSDKEELSLQEIMEESRRSEQLDETADATFWDRVALPDVKLAMALVNRKLTAKQRELIAADYEAVFQAGSTSRERGSVREHLQDLISLTGNDQLKQLLGHLPAN